MELENHDKITDNGKPPKRSSKVRDLLTDRVVGIVAGACIPVIILIIPLFEKYLDNSKEIQTLQIQNNADDIQSTNERLNVITQAFVSSQIKSQELTEKLTKSVVELKKITENLEECQHGCEPVCAKLGFIRRSSQ